MTKSEFLEKLRHALANDLSGPIVQDNVRYYDSYISDEVRKGRREEDVIAELGDPWAIAKTIVESVEIQGNTQDEYGYEPYNQRYEQEQQKAGGHVHVFGFDTWWKKLLLILGIVGIIMVVVAVIGGLISLLAPILLPLLIIMFVIRVLGNRRQ